ncbi:hypothetical protein K6119_17540 [Paracrocinitomix mangrovi]|uniref:hypothetical protein n=1 Tax=Paracrocinitomix mangrovi TaxID=2862509 RepID=UPI001C8EFF02|nr:hypothetical protein [Paracrocinitomix mangrovi]UKN01530.1 hypothetical protein K6119_17540 [Paracrocinitomix mangrovi]
MKKLLTLFTFLTVLLSYGQDNWDDLSGEEKAFFYHVARRREIIKPELLHLFEFTDSMRWINDTLPNYKHVEREVISDPSKIILHKDQFSRKADGVVSDLATHFALWELDQVLKFRNSDLEIHQHLRPKQEQFEKYVLEKIPQSAVQTLGSGKFVVRKAIQAYYEPALQTSDRMAGLANAGFSLNDQMLIVNAIEHAEEKYVQVRSYEIFQMLGGEAEDYINILSAAGDGSGFSSLEGGLPTPYNRTLPDDKGMFRFTFEIKVKPKTYEQTHSKRPVKDEEFIAVNSVRKHDFKTRGDMSTVVHFDVYGYHPERQTTMVIQKGGASYVLYGKNEHRLLSPDSTYGKGTTYWRLLYELEHVHIAKLNEALYGKRGYEFHIDRYEKKIESTLMLIKKTEKKLDELRHKPEGKPKIKKKKFKKKDLETSDQSGTGHPTSALSKNDKKKNIEQNRLVHLNTQLENEKRILAELKLEMEIAYFKLQEYKTLLDVMQKNIGYIFMEYEQEGDIYTFKDGATFNYATQDFTFPANGKKESFKINHIAFGKTVFASSIDETFVHMLLTSVKEEDKYTYEKYVGRTESTFAMSENDSIQTMEIFQKIIEKEMPVEMTVYAGGIVGKNDQGYYRDSTTKVEDYNKENELNDQVWKYRADWDSKINLEVTVWQDAMKPFNFESMQKGYDKLKGKYPQLNEIDYSSAIKAHYLAYQWVEQMKQLVPKWFKKPEEQSAVLKALNKVKIGKVGFADGSIWAKVPLVKPGE